MTSTLDRMPNVEHRTASRPDPLRPGTGTGLLERSKELDLLTSVLAAASGGRGGVVLVAGEAGIGKSTLIRSFIAGIGPEARVLVGACEDLVTPRTLGAIRDAFAGRSERVRQILADGGWDDLPVAVLDELRDSVLPTVLVIEDIHWADDATLDVLRYVSRRLDGTPTVLLVSYRDDEIGRDHPAQRLLGGLGGVPAHRVVVPKLSRTAVATLAGGTVATSAALYRLTGGNPFYVTEVVASGDAEVPLTVVDAVLARIHQLDPAVQTMLEQLAVIPSRVELPLARDLLGDLGVLAEAERRGVLEVRPDAVAFRHELARRAVEQSLPVSDRLRLHARALQVLVARGILDLPRIVHHAVQAGDDARVVEFAPLAAAQAARAGSFAQEITYYRQLLEREHLMSPTEIAGVRQKLAVAHWMVDEPAESLEHGLAAVRIREELGDVAALGEALIVLQRPRWALTRTADAMAGSTRAVELLSSVAEGPHRTSALLHYALMMNVMGHADMLVAAEKAAASARRTGVAEFVAMSQTCLGRARLLLGQPDEGLELMRAGLASARAVNAHFSTLMTYALMVQDLFDLNRFQECRRAVDEALAYAEEREVSFYTAHLRAYGYRLQALHGEWDEAIRGLREIVDTSRSGEKGSLRATLAPLACLLGRRGADDAPATLAWAHDFATRAECYYDWRWTCIAEIETAWSNGRPADADDAIARLNELTARPGREVERGELNRWKRRMGRPHGVTPGCPRAFAAGIRGDWRDAAAAWEAIGAPYEQALELLDSGEAAPTLRALEIFDGLGAVPAARLARHRLRALGSQIPRGPQPTTRANPAGLTRRQMEILHLIARGLSNAEIAAEAVVSVRTVDHHVTAILQKLGAPNRVRAAVIARELGVSV